MRFKVAVLLAVAGAVIGLVSHWAGAPAAASQPASIAAGHMAAVCLAQTEPEYVGSKKCKMCHSKVYKSWEETSHGKAFELLKPNKAAAAKEKFGLDPAKDYTTDQACLPCHTVGFGKKGGYAVPDPSDAKAVKAMGDLEGVGCENCHGPGSQTSELKSQIKKEKRKYKFEELAALGMTKVEESTCTACHNEKGPTFDPSKGFNFEERKADKDAIHEHEELKLREG